MATALCPGSFDPVTLGHLDIIERTARHFDDVIVAVIRNPQKTQSLFSLEERQEMLKEATAAPRRTSASSSSRACSSTSPSDHGADAIVKGLRAVSDFDYELQMAQMNQRLSGIDTFFISTSPQHSFLSSSLVREVAQLRRRRVGHGAAERRRPARRDVRRASAGGGRERCSRTNPSKVPDLERAARASCATSSTTARTMPMSASVLGQPRRVRRDRSQDAIDGLPEELRQARWLLKERDEYLEQARHEAERIVEAARVQAERMVESTEVVREARRAGRGDRRRRRAPTAGALRHEAEDYVDRKLAAFEVVLDRTMQTVQKGRERLQAVVEPLPSDLPDEHTGLESMYDERRARGLRPGRRADVGALRTVVRSVRRRGPTAILALRPDRRPVAARPARLRRFRGSGRSSAADEP